MGITDLLEDQLREVTELLGLDFAATRSVIDQLEEQLSALVLERLELTPVLPHAPGLAHGAALLGMITDAHRWLHDRDPLAADVFISSLTSYCDNVPRMEAPAS